MVGKDGKLPPALGAVGTRGPQGERGPQGPAGAAGSGSTSGRPSGPAGGALIGTYPNPGIAASAVGGAQVTENSLTGNDINESTLAQVPTALVASLGGLGRRGRGASCDPDSEAFVTCASVTVNLPARTHVLILGQVTASPEVGAKSGYGDCRLGTSVTGGLSDTRVEIGVVSADGRSEFGSGTAIGVSPLLGPGPVSFGIDCNQENNPGAIRYFDPAVTAIALSPN